MNTICKTCTMGVTLTYTQEIYKMVFKNTFEERTNIFCSMMQQNIDREILTCSHYVEKK